MSRYSLRHLSDQTLLRDLAAMVGRERESTADVLAHIAEVSARRLHLKAAYPSMTAYCIAKFHLSEGGAAKRVRAAHAARRFPVILDMVADGRLHLSAVVALARYLKRSNVEELLAAAVHRTRAEIEAYLARKFPRTDLLALVTAIPAPAAHDQALGGVPATTEVAEARCALAAPGPTRSSPEAPGPADTVSRVTTLSTQSYAMQFTMSTQGYELFRRAQDLLGHQIPSGDIARVIEKALELAVAQLEKRKFAATSSPLPARRRQSANPRYISADVKRAVRARDGDQCTFVSEDGHRCDARSRLEFDHIEPCANGGKPTVGNLRLRCRAHNQYTAEQTFGAEFMRQKRIAASGSSARRTSRQASRHAEEPAVSADTPVAEHGKWPGTAVTTSP